MKPLPDLADEAAMLLRGRRSALAAARAEAEAALRDGYTHLSGCDIGELRARLAPIKEAVQRLDTVCVLWESVQ